MIDDFRPRELTRKSDARLGVVAHRAGKKTGERTPDSVWSRLIHKHPAHAFAHRFHGSADARGQHRAAARIRLQIHEAEALVGNRRGGSREDEKIAVEQPRVELGSVEKAGERDALREPEFAGEFFVRSTQVAIADERVVKRLRVANFGERLQNETEQQPDAWVHNATEEEITFADTRVLVRRVINTLPEAQQQAINLAFFRGMSQREIAAKTNTPLGTVKTRLELGLKKIYDGLKELRDEL